MCVKLYINKLLCINMKAPKSINNLKSCFKEYNKINIVPKKEVQKRNLHTLEDKHKDF